MTTHFNPRKLTCGLTWRAKPASLWIDLPMVTITLRPGNECPNCCGQGGWSIEAGDTCSYDECETCEGKGRV